jgi:Icc-related predicted phosphoesterase
MAGQIVKMMRRKFYEDGRVCRVDDQGAEKYLYTRSCLKDVTKIRHRSSSLKLLAFSDCRSQDIGTFIARMQEWPKPDLILYGGDDVARFRAGGRNLFEEIAALSRYGLCAVAGNDDGAANQHITGANVYAVHTTALELGAFAIVGLEGAPWFPQGVGEHLNKGHLLYPEPDIERIIQAWPRFFPRKKLIVVSHAPPYQVLDFAVRHGRRHIGSRPLRSFLESSTEAMLCVCGHVHFCGGQHEHLGASTVVNCASHDDRSESLKIALIEIDQGKVPQVDWKQVPNIDSRQRDLF